METPSVEPDSQPAVETADDQTQAAPAAAETTDPNTTANGERLDRQTRNWRALERDRDHWREMAMRSPPQPRAESPKAEAPQRDKTLADFDFDQQKYAGYMREQVAQEAEATARRVVAQERETQARQAQDRSFNQRMQSFYKENPEAYQAISDPAFVQSDALIDELKDAENPGAIALYLANNPDVADSVNGMSGRQLTRAIAQIEAKVEAAKSKSPANAMPRGAPPAPAPKVEGGTAVVTDARPDSPDSDSKLSADEWMRRRNKQLAKR